MRLHADPKHQDYHEVVNFAKGVTVDGAELKHCVSVDTKAGLATVVTQPIRVKNEQIVTHTVTGKIEISWAEGSKLFEHLYNDWVKREELREQEQHAV